MRELECRTLHSLTPAGLQFQINTFTAGDQFAPALAADYSGDFVAVWVSDGQDGSGPDIFAQRYNASGVAQGTEFQLNTYTTGIQAKPAVTMDHNGDFVVTWTSEPADANTQPAENGSGAGVFARRYNAAGNLLDGANTGTAGTNYVFNFFVLAADANHDRTVDVTDLGILATNWQSTGRNFAQGDFNYDGTVDVTDLGILATNWQKSLAAPLMSMAISPSVFQPAQRGAGAPNLAVNSAPLAFPSGPATGQWFAPHMARRPLMEELL